jgi:ferric-dicitrate binding protein FerR (iron transport regulator)
MKPSFYPSFVLLIFIIFSRPASLHSQEEDPRFRAVQVQGYVAVLRDETEETKRLHEKEKVDDGDTVTTGPKSTVVLRLADRLYVRLGPNSKLHISRLRSGEGGPVCRLNLVTGSMLCQADKIPTWALEASMGPLIARCHGTLFDISRKKDDVLVTSFEGSVVVTAQGRSRIAKKGEVLNFRKGKFRYTNQLKSADRARLGEWKTRLSTITKKSPVRKPTKQ